MTSLTLFPCSSPKTPAKVRLTQVPRWAPPNRNLSPQIDYPQLFLRMSGLVRLRLARWRLFYPSRAVTLVTSLLPSPFQVVFHLEVVCVPLVSPLVLVPCSCIRMIPAHTACFSLSLCPHPYIPLLSSSSLLKKNLTFHFLHTTFVNTAYSFACPSVLPSLHPLFLSPPASLSLFLAHFRWSLAQQQWQFRVQHP